MKNNRKKDDKASVLKERKKVNLFSPGKIEEQKEVAHLMENSSLWKLARPLRFLGRKLQNIKTAVAMLPKAIERKGGIFNLCSLVMTKIKVGGWSGLKGGIIQFIRVQQGGGAPLLQNADTDFLFHVKKVPGTIFKTTVLIIAELSIPQCTKYRVNQKKELFDLLGIKCEVVSWTDYVRAKHLISVSSLVIFYRTPGYDSVLFLIEESKRLQIPTFWEVDDLIFSPEVLSQSRTTNSLDISTKKALIEGAVLYKKAMQSCGRCIASTVGLAEEMKKEGVQSVYVIENILDNETLQRAEKLLLEREKSKKKNEIIRIVYGSGTNTHNIDFEEAAPSIARILRERNDVIFRIIGPLELPEYFKGLESKIERINFCSYPEYLGYLAECEISIAPLEDFIFNDSKSNIKYLEASVLKVPSVCSPSRAFSSTIVDGENGLLARTDDEWYSAFCKLIENQVIREDIADSAYHTVMQKYSKERMSNELLKLVKCCQTKEEQLPRLISFNVFYRPFSFGGATIVAEQLNDLMILDKDYEVYVVTTFPVTDFTYPYGVIRYELKGCTIFGICIPERDMDSYNNTLVGDAVNEILDLVNPDVAHIHCIQGLGVKVLDACTQRHIKTVVTLHDAWWMCSKQFMIKADGKFCHQYKLDEKECRKCSSSPSEYQLRSQTLKSSLEKAEILLAPSKYFADLYSINLNRPVICHKNGVRFPRKQFKKYRGRKIRFGYVGGNTAIKGWSLIVESFRKYNFENAELVIVDNLLNLGKQSFTSKALIGIKQYRIVPAYTQDNIDDFFASIDVLLFPTQWKESFGLTVREAIIRNVWVIATDAGGVIDDIIEGENGTIIPFDSESEELSSAIVNVINRYMLIDEQESINLPKKHITTFEQQKKELIDIFS